jgi:hypothetical protein
VEKHNVRIDDDRRFADGASCNVFARAAGNLPGRRAEQLDIDD